jgi:hypothetical protein
MKVTDDNLVKPLCDLCVKGGTLISTMEDATIYGPPQPGGRKPHPVGAFLCRVHTERSYHEDQGYESHLPNRFDLPGPLREICENCFAEHGTPVKMYISCARSRDSVVFRCPRCCQEKPSAIS